VWICAEQAVIDYKNCLESDDRRGPWLDPSRFKATLAEWGKRWWPSLDLDLRTPENYESYLRVHILPRFGESAMGTIAMSDIRIWKMEAAEAGYAPSTISSCWVNLLSMISTDAVDERLIPANLVKQTRPAAGGCARRVRSGSGPRRGWSGTWPTRPAGVSCL
jgi:hypothetical protein